MNLRNITASVRQLITPEDERPTCIPDRPSRAPMRSGTMLRKPRRIPTGRKHVFLISALQSIEMPKMQFEPGGILKIGETDDGLDVFSTGMLERALRYDYDIWLVNDSANNMLYWWDRSDIPDEQVIDFSTFNGDYRQKMLQTVLFLYSKFGLSEFIPSHATIWQTLYTNLTNFGIGEGCLIPERILSQ